MRSASADVSVSILWDLVYWRRGVASETLSLCASVAGFCLERFERVRGRGDGDANNDVCQGLLHRKNAAQGRIGGGDVGADLGTRSLI